ncbi:venom phosphodiesterase-like [Anneissia japonica]|uniref:venom phosphodiesterase-like n=1 Tax=Anneissia japonica TaxID=1529436 RepID=UPI001425B752|nr:venom phosphodiesterase-like [Anneissia japonica]
MSKSDMNLCVGDDMKYVQTPSTRNLIVGGFIVLALGIGAGIGIGFAIGYNTYEEELPNKEEQQGNCLPSGQNVSWFNIPCPSEDTSLSCPHGYEDPPLLLISLDGFRPDYLTRNKDMVPNINKLRNCGSYAPYMMPSFPSVTFPNHYTIVTGLYPESHGIIGNNMYDPDLGVFSLSGTEKFDKRWWGGEPIWNTVMKQGKRAATYFWPGSDVDIEDIRPNYYFTYDGAHTYEQRIDVVLGWLMLPIDRRPSFITLYYDEPDHIGHDPGPFSDEINGALKSVDDVIGRLMDGLAAFNLHNCINMVVVADHGMANRSCDQIYMQDDYLPASQYYRRTTAGTMLRLDPKSSAELQDPRDIVAALQCTSPIATAYVKEDLPKRWHYINNIRIEDSLVPVEAGWTATGGPTTFCDGGTHGYDNLDVSMECVCPSLPPSKIKEYDEQLKLTESLKNIAVSEHAPFGRPITNVPWEFCELAQTDYLTGYSHDHSIALYVSYTLSQSSGSDVMSDCVRPDVRVTNEFTRKCVKVRDAYNSTISTGYLFQPGFSSSGESQMDALISSNVVPHYTNFTSDLWQGYLETSIRHWSNAYGRINVIAGTAFDYNADGLADDAVALSNKNKTVDGQLVPTHYYVVVTRCAEGELNKECPDIKMVAFILRHMDGIQTCKPPTEFLETHVARVRDVELLTGLIFHPDIEDVYATIRLETFIPMRGDLWKLWQMPKNV